MSDEKRYLLNCSVTADAYGLLHELAEANGSSTAHELQRIVDASLEGGVAHIIAALPGLSKAELREVALAVREAWA